MQSKPASVFFDASAGRHYVQCKEPLAPLEVIIEAPDRKTILNGNQITIWQQCADLAQLDQLLTSLYFGMPILLAIELADPPTIERIGGRIGDVPFTWELVDWRVELDITTQERQEQRFVTACVRFGVVSPSSRRRLLAALRYFYIACRLRREEKAPGEFLAEALLNLSEVLEVLFGRGRDAVRIALRFADDQIERDFIPAMVLRNEIDVGYPSLALFTSTQLETLHRFADRSERVFRDFLVRLLDAVAAGRTEIPEYNLGPADANARNIIDKLSAQLAALGDRP